jgi:hypothetical protein
MSFIAGVIPLYVVKIELVLGRTDTGYCHIAQT